MIDLYFWPTQNGKKITILLEEAGIVESRGIEPGRLARVDIDNGERYAPLLGRCDEVSHDDPRIKAQRVDSIMAQSALRRSIKRPDT